MESNAFGWKYFHRAFACFMGLDTGKKVSHLEDALNVAKIWFIGMVLGEKLRLSLSRSSVSHVPMNVHVCNVG